jgi:hypothetical protein
MIYNLLFVQMQPFNIIGKHSPDISPTGATPDKVIFFVALNIIQNGLLINQV